MLKTRPSARFEWPNRPLTLEILQTVKTKKASTKLAFIVTRTGCYYR